MRIALPALVAAALVAPAVQEKQPASTFLFNGRDLSGWKQFAGKPEVWKAEGGVLVCTGGGGGWLGTAKEYADFELSLEYRLTPGGNSGVYLRAPAQGHISRVGMEIQLLDDTHPRYRKLNNYQYTGSIYHVVGPSKIATKPAPAWNALKVRAAGRRVAVWVNGEKVVDAHLDQFRQDPAVEKEHPGLARSSGHIGLQSHTDRVEFRNIRIRELKEGGP